MAKARVIQKNIYECGGSIAIIIDCHGVRHTTSPTPLRDKPFIRNEEFEVNARAKECVDQLNQIADLKPTE